jgi:hypothetical protein
MTWSLALDGLLIIFLALALVYAVQLNRQLARMRADQAELERLAVRFAEASGRAEDGIARLKVAVGASRDELDRVERLGDDLRFLIERGTGVADRLEARITQLRTADPAAPAIRPVAPPPAPPPAADPPAATRRPAARATVRREAPSASDDQAGLPRSRAERELLSALRAAGIAPS